MISSEKSLTPDSILMLEAERRRRLKEKEKYVKWEDIARKNQLPPEGEWLTWFIMAGRGFGKTRSGAEYAKKILLEKENQRFALVSDSFADGRDVMVEGFSGLLSILPPSKLYKGSVTEAWNRSMGELRLYNGSFAKIYSSENPGALRGPQFHGAWGDEPAKWKDAKMGVMKDTTFSNLMFGLRLGDSPRLCLTGTPEKKQLIRDIVKRKSTIVVRGSTYENLANLSPSFKEEVLSQYEGTRLGQQEIHGVLLEDTEGALFSGWMFEVPGFRLEQAPPMEKVVIGVDPSISDTQESDEMGIIAMGKGFDGRFYLMGDYTVRGSVGDRVSAIERAFNQHHANSVIVEKNAGGDWIKATIEANNPLLAAYCRMVHASRGKQTRADFASLKYEKGEVSHIGKYPELENEMVEFDGNGISPNRLDAMVWAFAYLIGRGTIIRGGSSLTEG